jgi:hypothetical protein
LGRLDVLRNFQKNAFVQMESIDLRGNGAGMGI